MDRCFDKCFKLVFRCFDRWPCLEKFGNCVVSCYEFGDDLRERFRLYRELGFWEEVY